jgi:poly(3-hydroxybutyrate) depolymerase
MQNLLFACALATQYVPAGQNVFWTIDGISREARVVLPTVATNHPPVVICFHGGGGQAYYAVDEYAIHKNWPEALVYYAEGRVGSGGFSTWSPADIPFFDTMRGDALRGRAGDRKRVFVMGYSTGANFCGDLWAARGYEIAGFAFVSGGRYKSGFLPRPVYLNYAVGEPDAHRLAELGKTLDAWGRKARVRIEVMTRSGGHTYPQTSDGEIADFLKSCPALP